MLFEDEKPKIHPSKLINEDEKVYKNPLKHLNFQSNKEIANFHNTIKNSNLHHGIILPYIYSIFPELLDDLILSISDLVIEKFELQQNENGNILMEQLIECLSFAQKTSFAHKKVIVIHQICSLSLSVANALLKILEEPPKDTFFLMTFEKGDLILPTIKSRALFIQFKNSDENFSFIVDNFIKSNIPQKTLESLTAKQINLLSLFKHNGVDKILESFNNLIVNFSYINFKNFFNLYRKEPNFEGIIFLLIENEIKKFKNKSSISLFESFILYKKYTITYNTSLELFLYYIINKICYLRE